MGVGQVISDTFGMVKARFGPMLGLWAIYFAITMVLFVVMAAGVGAVGLASLGTMAEANMMAAGGGMIALIALFYLGYVLVALAQYASLILMASPSDRTTVGAALSAGWRAAPALLLLLIVLVLAYLACALVFGLLGAAFSALGDAGGIVLAVLLVPVLVWVGCRLNPLFAVVAVDGVRNPITAIRRSWRLTRGHALTIFLASLVFMLIVLLVFAVALLPSIGLLRGMADPVDMTEAAAGSAIGGFVLLMLGMLVASVLFNLLYCAFLAVIHGTLTSAAGEGTAETFA